MLEILLEITRYTLPAIVVYFLMRQFIRGHMATEQMKIRASLQREDKGLRVQAYERLTLFCERISIISLMMRLNSNDMNSDSLNNALLIAVQKEFEHNLTQQIFVSSQLWEMIELLKNNTIAAITNAYSEFGEGDKSTFEDQLLQQGRMLDGTMARKVKEAIRKEVELYFK